MGTLERGVSRKEKSRVMFMARRNWRLLMRSSASATANTGSPLMVTRGPPLLAETHAESTFVALTSEEAGALPYITPVLGSTCHSEPVSCHISKTQAFGERCS